ncbi:MAG: ABC transporter permease [Oscillospiraceae bacterium]
MKSNVSAATRGWKKVFGFTFVQYVKTKSFIVGTIIVSLITMLIVAGVNLIPKWMGAGEKISDMMGQDTQILLNTVYIQDNSGILTEEDMQSLTSCGLPVKAAEKGAQELIDELSGAQAGQALVTVTPQEYNGAVTGYAVKTYYSPETDGSSVDAAISLVSNIVTYRNIITLGVSPEDFAASQRTVVTSKIQAGSDEWNVFESMINYMVPIVSSLILFILIFAYGQTVAQSIATEKTSRVMELLLTSVRPLAVVIGKVLAMGLVSLLQFILIGVVAGGTFAVTAPFGIGGDLLKMLADPSAQVGESAEIVQAFTNSFGNISPLSIILIFVIFILGFIFFALIAALVGASVSRMEDLAQAMQPYSLLGVLGCYLAYFPVIFNAESIDTGAATTNPVQIFSYYFPVSSPFALPSAMLLGTLSMTEVIIAVLILAVFVVLVAVIVARVYEMIILHNGSRLKMGDILKMAGKK